HVFGTVELACWYPSSSRKGAGRALPILSCSDSHLFLKFAGSRPPQLRAYEASDEHRCLAAQMTISSIVSAILRQRTIHPQLTIHWARRTRWPPFRTALPQGFPQGFSSLHRAIRRASTALCAGAWRHARG